VHEDVNRTTFVGFIFSYTLCVVYKDQVKVWVIFYLFWFWSWFI